MTCNCSPRADSSSVSVRRSSRTSRSATRCPGRIRRRACASTSSPCAPSGSTWNEGAAMNFRGEFYRHTLMSPFFNPGPNPYGAPPVTSRPSGELMTEVAGEVADGLLIHPFSTERYIREVTLPALGARAGEVRSRVRGLSPLVLGTHRDRQHRRGTRQRREARARLRSPSTVRRRPIARCSSCTAGANCRAN